MAVHTAVVPDFPCNDCGVNTVPLEGDREYYEVHDYLWTHDARAPGIGQSDHGIDGFYLCVGCLETRLGRQLKRADFKSMPANMPSPWLSLRLNDRLGNQPLVERIDAIQFFPNALTESVIKRFRPDACRNTPTGAWSMGISIHD
jgi:hypothetical protein